jgi:hypothetical protein
MAFMVGAAPPGMMRARRVVRIAKFILEVNRTSSGGFARRLLKNSPPEADRGGDIRTQSVAGCFDPPAAWRLD